MGNSQYYRTAITAEVGWLESSTFLTMKDKKTNIFVYENGYMYQLEGNNAWVSSSHFITWSSQNSYGTTL